MVNPGQEPLGRDSAEDERQPIGGQKRKSGGGTHAQALGQEQRQPPGECAFISKLEEEQQCEQDRRRVLEIRRDGRNVGLFRYCVLRKGGAQIENRVDSWDHCQPHQNPENLPLKQRGRDQQRRRQAAKPEQRPPRFRVARGAFRTRGLLHGRRLSAGFLPLIR